MVSLSPDIGLAPPVTRPEPSRRARARPYPQRPALGKREIEKGPVNSAFPFELASGGVVRRIFAAHPRSVHSKSENRIMRYELSYYEWTAIKPCLPNEPSGVPRGVIGVLNGTFGYY